MSNPKIPAKQNESGVNVPQEKPDPEAASRKPEEGAEDRPGFDLGGAVGERTGVGSSTVPGGPRDPLPTDAPGRAPGHPGPGSAADASSDDAGGPGGAGISSGSDGLY